MLGAILLTTSRERLGDHGFSPDPGRVERARGGLVLYHYTRPEHLNAIMVSGLIARRPVVGAEELPELRGSYQADGLLEPLPRGLGESPYFGDLDLEMLRMVSDLLLRLELPVHFPGRYLADFAHPLECVHHERHGRAPLGLGYDCRTRHQAI